MRFIDGTDADAVAQDGPMHAERAIRIIDEVAKALDYAHKQNVIHRDIKPANFLLSGVPGPDERVLLADFGIARALDDASLTGTGEVMATVAYAAPEVIIGDLVDRRADLYSLGCALFRLLTGQTPFAHFGTQAAVLHSHLNRPPPRVTDYAPWLPPALDKVIASALAKDPRQRFDSATNLAAAARTALYPYGRHSVPLLPPPRPSGSTPHPGPTVPQPKLPAAPPTQPSQHIPIHRKGGRRSKILAGLTGALVLVIAVISAMVWPSNDTAASEMHQIDPSDGQPAAPQQVADSALPGLLLSSEEISSFARVTMKMGLVYDFMPEGSDVLSGTDCLSAWRPAQRPSFIDTGWSAVQAQVASQEPPPPGPEAMASRAIQAVIALPTAEATQNIINNRFIQWIGCSGRVIEVNGINGPEPWTVGETTHNRGALTIILHNADDTSECQRAMSIRHNIVIDISFCAPSNLTNQAVDISEKIADKITL